MQQKGELVKRGNINEKGDVEFWEDGSEEAKRDPTQILLNSLISEKKQKAAQSGHSNSKKP